MTNAPAKLREARFFLGLLETLECTGTSLVSNFQIREQVSFALSGALNALYSATEHLKSSAGALAVQEFKKSHPVIFDSKNGLRNLTVHERHIAPSPVYYVPPKGNAVHLVFSEPATQSANLVFRAEYYVEVAGEHLNIVGLCREHCLHLSEFAAQHGLTDDA